MVARGLLFSFILHAMLVFGIFVMPPATLPELEEVTVEFAFLPAFPSSGGPDSSTGGALEPPVPLALGDLVAQATPDRSVELPQPASEPLQRLEPIIEQTAALDLEEPEIAVLEEPQEVLPAAEQAAEISSPDQALEAPDEPPPPEPVERREEPLPAPEPSPPTQADIPLPELEVVEPDAPLPVLPYQPTDLEDRGVEEPLSASPVLPPETEVAAIEEPEPVPPALPAKSEVAEAPGPLPPEPQRLAEVGAPEPAQSEQPTLPQGVAAASPPLPSSPVDQDLAQPEEPQPLALVPEPVPQPAVESEPRLVRRSPPPEKPDRFVILPEIPREAATPEPLPDPPQVAALSSETGPQPSQGTRPNSAADLVRTIQQQVAPCWRSVPGEAGGVSSVVVLVTLNRNGTIRNMLLKDRQRAETDQAYRRLAKGAEAAFLRCGPYRLPGDQYAQWRELEVDFHTIR